MPAMIVNGACRNVFFENINYSSLCWNSDSCCGQDESILSIASALLIVGAEASNLLRYAQRDKYEEGTMS
jgi:hypothetical protein